MKMFVSYCHKDNPYCVKLRTHLTTLCEEHNIQIEIDTNTLAGEDFKTKIHLGLNESQIVLLLVSANFLASNECKYEMHIAKNNMEKQGISVVPIIVSECDWQNSEIKMLKALPTDGKAITSWTNEHSAYLDIVKELRKIVNKRMANKSRSEFIQQLQETEFKHDNKDRVTLEDIFVAPCIVESREDSRGVVANLSSLVSTPDIILFHGESQSGKSAICKQIYLERIKDGKLSILLNGSGIKKYRDCDKLIGSAFREQYEGHFEVWNESHDRMVIIDDFNVANCRQVIDHCKSHEIKVTIAMSRNEFISNCGHDKLLATARIVRIQEFSHLQQERLIRKWKLIGTSLHHSGGIEDGTVDQAENLVNSIISRYKIVPRYPFYILAILQSMAAITSQDLTITRFGHVYHALLTSQLLAIGVHGMKVESILNFLGYLAFRLFDNERQNGKALLLNVVVDEYCEDYIINEGELRQFIKSAEQLMVVEDGELSFRYQYIYYFLLGRYFAKHPDHFDKISQDLISHSHTRQNSFILVFTIHHSNNNELINLIVDNARSLFSEGSAATLSNLETSMLRPALSDIPKRLLSTRTVQREREIERAHRDRVEREYLNEIENDEDFDGTETYLAARNMEILGQIVMNKYGSMKKEETEVIIGAICDLALRMIKVFLSMEILESLETFIETERKSKDHEHREFRLRVLFDLSRKIRYELTIVVLILLMKAASVLGEIELSEVFQRLRDRRASPAYRLIYCFYVLRASDCLNEKTCKVLVDTVEKFKKDKDEVAERLLSIAVQHYFNTHKVNYRFRQRVCGALGVEVIVNREN